MIVYNYDADLEVSDTCVRSSLLSWVCPAEMYGCRCVSECIRNRIFMRKRMRRRVCVRVCKRRQRGRVHECTQMCLWDPWRERRPSGQSSESFIAGGSAAAGNEFAAELSDLQSLEIQVRLTDLESQRFERPYTEAVCAVRGSTT